MLFFFPPFIFAGCQKKRCREQETTRQCREGNHFKTFGMQQMPLTLGGSLDLLFSCSSLMAALQGAAALLTVCVCVCVFRILNSKGWGLIMEPDSSSPASICLTVPPIFPSIPSLPPVTPQFLIRCVSPWLWPSFVFLSFSSFVAPSLPPSLLLSSAPLGPSVFQGHVRGVEEHVGVIVVVIAEVDQVSLGVAHRPGVVLSDPRPVTQPRLQSQLENRHKCRKWSQLN